MFGNQYLAVDIGNRNIKAVHGGVSNKKIEIKEYGIFDTPANSIRDGKITNVSAVADSIRMFVEKNRIKAKKLILNVTGTGVITRDILLPQSNEDEVEKMLEYEAQQYFPVDLKNYVLDFKLMEDITSDEGRFTRVLLVAVPVKQVDEYMKLPGLMKMEPAAVDIPANCISKLVSYLDFHLTDETAAEYAVVDIGCETVGVSIFNRNVLKFNRILLNGSGDIDRLISENYSMSPAEAEKKKIASALVVPEESDGSLSIEDARMSNIVKPAVDAVISDINRFFDFYLSRSTGNKIGRIYLCGGGSRLKGLPEYISAYFNIPVEFLTPGSNIVYRGSKGQEAFLNDYVLITGAVGATVRNGSAGRGISGVLKDLLKPGKPL
ncbi:MAG: type IV pilus assembly protein PilM [Clostridiales bacterium]|jgi:type IV pilus assembly protein PilM|nr:type IV pilus assembly protein PilM [Eubacteriales bacterium]MDH7565255.1 type IV pilus assembly protein PilM [Clostridiales bacterium]